MQVGVVFVCLRSCRLFHYNPPAGSHAPSPNCPGCCLVGRSGASPDRTQALSFCFQPSLAGKDQSLLYSAKARVPLSLQFGWEFMSPLKHLPQDADLTTSAFHSRIPEAFGAVSTGLVFCSFTCFPSGFMPLPLSSETLKEADAGCRCGNAQRLLSGDQCTAGG